MHLSVRTRCWLSPGELVALVALLSLALVADPAFAQRGAGRMQGLVTDENGTPIAGVTVTAFNPEMTPGTLTATTSESGRWAILGLSNDNWKFTFEKAGYIVHEIDASVRGLGRNPNMDITLVAIEVDTAATSVGADVVNRELFDEGTALSEAGDWAGAVAKWEEFRELNPNVHLVNGNIGNGYRELGEDDKARAAYEKLLAIEPDNTMASYNLGEMLVEAGDPEGAMSYFEKVLAASPDDPAVYYNVAELYFGQREAGQAIEYYKRALEVDPGYFSAHKQMGFAYINAGDIPAAIAAFEKFVELAPEDNPDLPRVKDVLAALKSG